MRFKPHVIEAWCYRRWYALRDFVRECHYMMGATFFWFTVFCLGVCVFAVCAAFWRP